MPFDFFTEYTRIHHSVYGRDPCTREQWAEWCNQPCAEGGSPGGAVLEAKLRNREQGIDFDIETERREGWGYELI